MNLDPTDINILRLLQEDSSITTKELASKVNLSPTPVFERVKRLEKEGIIKKYAAILDADKLGLGFMVFCHIRLKQQNKECANQFMETIKTIKEVTECYNISGEYDFMIKIYAKSMQHYQDFVLNVLGEKESVGSFHSVFVVGEIKQTYSLPFL